MLRVDVITIFPALLEPYLAEGMLAIAQQKGLLQTCVHNLRDYATDRHRSVDDRPYGGGPGMVMMPGPAVSAVEAVDALATPPARRIMLSPQGRTFDQHLAAQFSAEPRLLLLCGRYEGFDERIRLVLHAEEISIGDYVLTGGELPALVLIDAVARLLPGVLGHQDSARLDSFSDDGVLDHPHYTRPAVFREIPVPEVLLSGNHKAIADWRRQQSLIRTSERRPDISPHRPPATNERST